VGRAAEVAVMPPAMLTEGLVNKLTFAMGGEGRAVVRAVAAGAVRLEELLLLLLLFSETAAITGEEAARE
jgi:hypothetical protein